MADQPTTTTTAATTPPPATETPAAEKPKLDPMVEQIMKSIGNVLEPDDIAGPAKEPEAQTDEMSTSTLGEAAVERRRREEAAKAKPKEEPPPAAEEKKVEPAPATEPPSAKQQEPPRPPIKLKKKESVVPEPEPAPEPPNATDTKPAVEPNDEAFIANLIPEEQDELELARYAEANGKKGVYAQTLDWFKKVAKWTQDNPGVDASSAEFEEFSRANRPKWTSTERRKIERQMVAEEAVRKAKAELEPAMEKQRLKVKEIETRPIIDHAIREVEASITSKPTHDGLEQINPEVVKMLNDVGFEQTLEKFKIEAPIVQGAKNAARAWLQISNGLVPFNVDVPAHAWLAEFISAEGANMKRQPKDVQTRDGRQFLPLHEFQAAKKQDPLTPQKFWTFTDDDIVQLISDHAVFAVNNEYKSLKKAGFERVTAKDSTLAGNPATAQASPPAGGSGSEGVSPRAGAKSLPGASVPSGKASEHAAFLNQLYPGAAEIVGTS